MSIITIAVLKNGSSKNFIFNPDIDKYKFEPNDSVVVIGDEKNIGEIKKAYQGSSHDKNSFIWILQNRS